MRLILLFSLFLAGCFSHPAPFYDMAMDAEWNMEYVSDQEQYGKSDVWVRGCPRRGDCEDLSLCIMEGMQADGVDSILHVCPSGDVAHSIVEGGDGWFYDPINGRVEQALWCVPYYSLPYADAMGRSIDG